MNYSDSQVQDLCKNIAKRLIEPLTVKNIITRKNNLSILGGVPWEDTILTAGYPSLVVLFSEMDNWYPNEGWDDIAHKYLLELQKSMIENGFYQNISVFSGLTGIAFAVRAASKNGVRYKDFLTQIDEMILERLDSHCSQLRNEKSIGISPIKVDIISGMAGAGRYLMNLKSSESKKVILKMIDYFDSSSKKILVNGIEREGWYITPDNLFTENDRKKYNNGAYNLGMAHGLAGTISFLSLLKLKDNSLNCEQSITRMTEWLIGRAEHRNSGLSWASILKVEEMSTPQNVSSENVRDAWCYGAAGIGRAIYLSGQSLSNQYYLDYAKKIFIEISNRGENAWNLEGPSFCHGLSGLMNITNRMYKDTGDFRYKNFVSHLRNLIMDKYSDKYYFGYKDEEGTNLVDKIGLLDGVSGILLSLISTCYNSATELYWDSLFMIS